MNKEWPNLELMILGEKESSITLLKAEQIDKFMHDILSNFIKIKKISILRPLKSTSKKLSFSNYWTNVQRLRGRTSYQLSL